ncbi:divalent-cation tolerance protein CutA [Roseivivax sp.]
MTALAVLTTLDDEAAARALARKAVEARLAACVHLEKISACFLWQGSVEEAPEWRLLFKTTEAAYDDLARLIEREHPYDLPALWAFEASRGAPAFLDWIAESTR